MQNVVNDYFNVNSVRDKYLIKIIVIILYMIRVLYLFVLSIKRTLYMLDI